MLTAPPISWLEDEENVTCPECFVTVGLARSNRMSEKAGHREFHLELTRNFKMAAQSKYTEVTVSGGS